MKVLLSNVSRENGHMIINAFYSALSGMNYPVIAHRDDMLKFLDIDEGFKTMTLKYDIRTRRVLMIRP
jgi:hypothetical protein